MSLSLLPQRICGRTANEFLKPSPPIFRARAELFCALRWSPTSRAQRFYAGEVGTPACLERLGVSRYSVAVRMPRQVASAARLYAATPVSHGLFAMPRCRRCSIDGEVCCHGPSVVGG